MPIKNHMETVKEIIKASGRINAGSKKLMHWRNETTNKNLSTIEEKQMIEICLIVGFKVQNMAGCKLLTKL